MADNGVACVPESMNVDNENQVLIVIPTMGHPDTLLPTINRLIKHVNPNHTRIMLSINPDNKQAAEAALVQCQAQTYMLPIELETCVAEGPLGFGTAVNVGLMKAEQNGGIPPYIIILNDDTRPTAGWTEGLIAALTTQTVNMATEPPQSSTGRRKDRPAASYGQIGIAGPVTNVVAGIQCVGPYQEVMELGYDGFAKNWRTDDSNKMVITTNFLSGFCLAFTRDAFKKVVIQQECGWGIFDGDVFPIGGYEDNDLAVRAERAGIRSVIAWNTFIGHVGHQSLDRSFPEQERGMKNRLRYYRKWRGVTQKWDNKIVAVYRVRIGCVNDLHVWRTSLARNAEIFDGVAVLMTNNPCEMTTGHDWEPLKTALTADDQTMLKGCASNEAVDITNALTEWVSKVTAVKGRVSNVCVELWDKAFNERDERNRSIEMAEGMSADWVLSVDHDEMLEDRLQRWHFDQVMAHPNPLVDSFEMAWINHWDSSRTVRIDMPWGDNGTYIGGMRGCRFWRVNKASPRRIMGGTANGLHCGNCPDSANGSRRLSAFRFRHFGYVRPIDRIVKFHRYNQLDPNPEQNLVGGSGYGHLVNEENMKTRPFVSQNGIGFHMLIHKGEEADAIGRWMDDIHGLVDRAVVIWTDEWSQEDKYWLEGPIDVFTIDEWPATGPSREMAEFAALFGVEWLHHPLEDNISAARNVGIEYLNQFTKEGLGWALFFDPDEHMPKLLRNLTALRELALVSDSWGWLFKFANRLRDGSASISESVRMSRLDPDNIMRMNGRVHESFGKATKAIRRRGEHPNFRYAPFTMLNYGTALTGDEIRTKLEWYRKMIYADLEEDPFQPGPWVTLGLQYNNDGNSDMARACFERGVMCADTSYLPYHQLALLHMRVAKALLKEVVNLTVSHHSAHAISAKTIEFLDEVAPGQPLMGDGMPIERMEPLPAFPIEQLMERQETMDSEMSVVCSDGEHPAPASK